MKLTKHGMREWLGSGMIALLVGAGGVVLALKVSAGLGWTIVGIAAVVWFAIAAFFRVPCRRIPQNPEFILSPADGLVRDIERMVDPEIDFFEGREMLRIGIFLSVLDVHVNRAPADMTLKFKRYREGFFHDARDKKASKENEAMIIAGVANVEGREFPVAVKQISGAIARRIVCPVEPEDKLTKGAIYGMIKFGSRTELYLPAEDYINLNVKVGDKVRSGTTVMAIVAKNA